MCVYVCVCVCERERYHGWLASNYVSHQHGFQMFQSAVRTLALKHTHTNHCVYSERACVSVPVYISLHTSYHSLVQTVLFCEAEEERGEPQLECQIPPGRLLNPGVWVPRGTSAMGPPAALTQTKCIWVGSSGGEGGPQFVPDWNNGEGRALNMKQVVEVCPG